MQSNSSGSGSGGEAGAGRHGEGPAPGVPAALGWQEDSPQPLSRESGGNGGESGPPGGGVRLLGWLQRVQVAVQACRGLKYLHEEAEHKVCMKGGAGGIPRGLYRKETSKCRNAKRGVDATHTWRVVSFFSCLGDFR